MAEDNEEPQEAEDFAEDDEDEGEGEDGEAARPPRKRRLSGRSLVLFVILPLLAVGAVAGTYVSGMFDAGEEVMAEAPSKPKVFYDLPEMLVNLSSQGEERAQYLKLLVSIELPDEKSREALKPVLPRIIDLFQVYLRELRISDLEGSAGIYRLKEELERRINVEIHPFSINDVLFREIIVQ